MHTEADRTAWRTGRIRIYGMAGAGEAIPRGQERDGPERNLQLLEPSRQSAAAPRERRRSVRLHGAALGWGRGGRGAAERRCRPAAAGRLQRRAAADLDRLRGRPFEPRAHREGVPLPRRRQGTATTRADAGGPGGRAAHAGTARPPRRAHDQQPGRRPPRQALRARAGTSRNWRIRATRCSRTLSPTIMRRKCARKRTGTTPGAAADASFRATMLLCRGQIWEEAVVHPWVLTLGRTSAGPRLPDLSVGHHREGARDGDAPRAAFRLCRVNGGGAVSGLLPRSDRRVVDRRLPGRCRTDGDHARELPRGSPRCRPGRPRTAR